MTNNVYSEISDVNSGCPAKNTKKYLTVFTNKTTFPDSHSSSKDSSPFKIEANYSIYKFPSKIIDEQIMDGKVLKK